MFLLQPLWGRERKRNMEIILARTQGFCAGVARAVKIVDQALDKYGAPLYVFHEIVHNTHVINDFKKRGVVFVERTEDVPEGRGVIFSAHGVSPAVVRQAHERRLKIIDATCPLVKKVHMQAIHFSQQNIPIALIGHRGHQEIIGTAGYITPGLLYFVENIQDVDRIPLDNEVPITYLTQTTLSIEDTAALTQALKEKFPNLIEPDKSNICYATKTRQDAVKELARMVEMIIVCGSASSSNSRRLRETGEKSGKPSCLIDRAGDLDLALLENKQRIGISSGASVPRAVVDDLVVRICQHFPRAKIRHLESPDQKVIFTVPEI